MTRNDSDRLAVALDAVRVSSLETLRWFQNKDLQTTEKSDRSPVTQADIAAEGILRREILGRFPSDGFLGEETGTTAGSSGYEWIVDPIDGTKSFIRGVPLWATLVGCRHAGHGLLGVIAIPALDEMVYATVGGGAWHVHGTAAPLAARVSDRRDLSAALACSSDFTSFARRPEALGGRVAGLATRAALEEACLLCRTWGDGYGYLLVATGRAELMVDPLMNAWDAAAVETVIHEAGGRFSDWQGRERIDSGEGVATNGLMHEEALVILRHAHPDAA